ncbi:hypothetical protein SFRURICE_012641 [Spodoptera frugiperda]|nr:hypothetical protein SFRURICE_012641 [Spodoptera frugiperda]
MLKGYTFFLCDSRNKSTDVYTCTVGRKCKARFVVTKDREFLKSCYTVHEHPPPKHIIRNVQWFTKPSGKEVAVLQGYTFYRDGRARVSDNYLCTLGRRCKARFVMDKERQYIKSHRLNHEHPPPKYILKNVTWARNVKGRSVAIVDDYTFYCNKQTASYSVWRCSRSSNCKARFTIRNNTLHRPHLVHEHDRLDYFILDGTIHKAC